MVKFFKCKSEREFLDDAIRMKDQPLGETTVKEKE
jgi:hypothetical protein